MEYLALAIIATVCSLNPVIAFYLMVDKDTPTKNMIAAAMLLTLSTLYIWTH